MGGEDPAMEKKGVATVPPWPARAYILDAYLFMCIYIIEDGCIYIHIICIHTYKHICVYIHAYVYMYIYIYIQTHHTPTLHAQ